MGKPSVSIWEDIHLSDATVILSFETPQDIKNFIVKKFNIDLIKDGLRGKIILDLYYYALVFAKENGFNEEQTSAFFSIVKRTHGKTIETPYGNTEEAFRFFQNMLTCHSVKRPPFYVDLFNIQQTKIITDYVLNTYFKHFKLYKYAFTPKVTMNVSITYQGLKPEPEPIPEITAEDCDENRDEIPYDEFSINEGSETSVEPKESEDENPAMRELKKIIRTTLDEQINKLKLNMDQKLKSNEDTVMSKMTGVSGRDQPSAKGGRKGGKKK